MPIYIGQTMTLRKRAFDHLKSVPLMKAVQNAANGKRAFLFCTVATKSTDKAEKQIKIIEKALIAHAQVEGHELHNKKGTKIPTHLVTFNGNRYSECIAPRKMRVKQT